MSSQLDKPLGTNLRNDATAENRTNSSDVNHVHKLFTNKLFEKRLKLVLYEKRVSQCLQEFIKLSESRAEVDWDFDLLGIKSFSRTVESLKSEARDISEMVDSRIQDTTASLAGSLEETNTSVRNVAETVLRALEAFSTNVNTFREEGMKIDFDFLKQMLDSPEQLIVLLSILYLLIEYVDRTHDMPELFYLKGAIAAFAVYKLGSKVLKLFSGWLEDTFKTQAQVDWADWLHIGVQGIVFALFGTTLDFTTAKNLVSGLPMVANNTVKLSECFTLIVEWFKNLSTMVCNAMGVEVWEYFKPRDLKIREFMERVQELNQRFNENPMEVDMAFNNNVARLFMEVNDYVKRIPLDSKNQPVNIALKSVQDKLSNLQRVMADAGMNIGDRDEALFVVIAGAPGLGKTYMSDFTAKAAAIQCCRNPADLIEYNRAPHKAVYSWPVDNKHHDEYPGSYVTLFPDLYCQTDAEGQPSEASNLIYLVGDQPMNLPAAELSKKQRLWFISKVIIANTNVTYIHNRMFKSLRNPDALRRRMNNFGWYTWVNPIYALRDADGNVVVDPATHKLKGYENGADYLYARIDVNLVPRDVGIVGDMWFFRRIDFGTGEFMSDRIYDYDGFLDLMRQAIDQKLVAGALKRQHVERVRNDFYERRVNALAGEAQMMDVPFIIADPPPIDDGFETPDEDDFVAQMDNRIYDGNIHFNHLRSFDRETLGHNAEPLYNGVDMQRERTLMRGSLPEVISYPAYSHQRLREIGVDALTILEMTDFSQLTILQNNIGLNVNPRNPKCGLIMKVMTDMMKAVDSDVRCCSVAAYLPFRDIVKLMNMSYGEASEVYPDMVVDFWIRDPVRRALTKARNVFLYLKAYASNLLLPSFAAARQSIARFFHADRVQMLTDVFLVTLVSTATPVGLVLMLELYISSRRKKEAKERVQEKKKAMRDISQPESSWTTSEGYKRVIDKHMDNFVGFYVALHIPSKKKEGTYDIKTRHPCNMIYLGGKTGVIVDHARKLVLQLIEMSKKPENKGAYIEIIVVPFVGCSVDSSTERFRVEELVFETSEQLERFDLSIVTFKHCRNRPSIWHLIPPLDCMNWMCCHSRIDGIFIERTADLNLEFVGPERRQEVVFELADGCNYVAKASIEGEACVLGEYAYPSLVMTGKGSFPFQTRPGYCSSPGFILDERKNHCVNMGFKHAQHPWLAYFHTSSQGLIPNGTPLFREMFQPWIDRMRVSKPIIDVINENIRVYSDVVEETMGLTSEGQLDTMILETSVEKIDVSHSSFASSSHSFFVPNKTEIVRSDLYGLDQTTRYPARMGVITTSEGVVDVMQKAREPYGVNNVLLNGPLVDQIIQQCMGRIMSMSGPPRNRNLLDLDQCLYGDSAYCLNSVNWNSSMGFYLRLMKDRYKQQWKGKRWMIGEDGKLTPESYALTSRLFSYHEEQLRRGERMCGVNIDNIKDELLVKKKVLEGNSRLFCTNEFMSILLCKRYMGSFAGWLFENRIRNSFAIGVNPYSEDWTSVATKILNNSPDCMFMDHKKYDKRQIRQIMKCVLVLMDMYYNDKGSDESAVRELLFEDIIDSLHVVTIKGKLVFYSWKQGNTSGNFLTAILNSLVNACYLYICAIYAWMLTKGIDPDVIQILPSNPADEALSWVSLGDDIVASVKKDKMPGVNFNSIKLIGLRYLNIEITDELKTEGAMPDFRKLEEGSFLGRTIQKEVVNGVVRYVGVLRRYSAIERVFWRKGPKDPVIETEKVESTLLELSIDTREVFESYAKRYAQACLEAYGIYPRFTDYDTARNFVLNLCDYKYTFDDFLNDDKNSMGPNLLQILERYRVECEKKNYHNRLGDEISLSGTHEYEVIHDENLTESKTPISSEINASMKTNKESISNVNKLKLSGEHERPTTVSSKMTLKHFVEGSAKISDPLEGDCCGLKYTPEMDNGSTDFESTMIVTQQATTTFMEAATVEEGISSLPTSTISTYIETNADIKSFLARPYLLANGSWTTSQTINTNLANGKIASLLTTVSMWANKVDGFNLVRGDFMLKVQINANPFHQGKLLLHYLPCQTNFVNVNSKYEGFKNKHLTQKIQHPHIELDCRKSSVVMRIPYVAPTQWYAMKEAFYDWGNWYLDVFSPLSIGPAAPASELFVDFLVYGWWENVELGAPTVAQSDDRVVTRKAKRRGGQEEVKESEGPIAMGLRKCGKVADALGEIPLVGDYAAPVSWISNILANVASVFGWSKPREEDGQTNVYNQIYRYAGTCDGPDTAMPGGITCLNRLETIDYGSFTNEDEMSLSYLYKVPYYCGEIPWSNTAGQGTSLLSQLIGPLSFLNTDSDVVGAHTATYEYHVPFTYLARMHKLWRGSLVLTLKFVKTQMHSGRIQVTWVPCNMPGTLVGIGNGAYNKRAIIDIRTEDTVSIELPYMLYTDYCSTVPIPPTTAYSGRLDIVVLNDLRAPESCAQTIGMQWFMTPGEDFELAAPSNVTASALPYMPQADGSELVRESVEQGMSMPTMEIGGTNTKLDKLFHARRCTGEKIMSVKQYLLRNSVVQGYQGSPFTLSGNRYMVIDPYFIGCQQLVAGTGAQQASVLGSDAFSLIAPWYAFFRGGIRMSVVDPGLSSSRMYSNALVTNGAFGTQPFNIFLTTLSGEFRNVSSLSSSSVAYPFTACNYNESYSGAYQHIPYYNRLPMSLCSVYNGIDVPSQDPSRPLATWVINGVSNLTANASLQRSVADDFQLMFFTGCPPLVRSYS